jgi:hypothetical protein
MRHRRGSSSLDGGLNKVAVAWLITSQAAVMPFPSRSDWGRAIPACPV